MGTTAFVLKVVSNLYLVNCSKNLTVISSLMRNEATNLNQHYKHLTEYSVKLNKDRLLTLQTYVINFML